MTAALAFLIRRPMLRDVKQMAAVHVDGWRETYGHLLPAEFYDEAALQQRIAMWTLAFSRDELPPRLFVAERDGNVVGLAYASASREPDAARELTLNLIYVRAEFHGTGIGQALLDATAGDEPMQLWVVKDNPRAIAFYRRNGFLADGAEKVDHDANGLQEIRLLR